MNECEGRLSRHQWVVIALLFVVALINYFDRQSLSVVAPKVQAELHLGDEGYAHIVSLFLFASAIAYGVSGFVSDWLGSRRSMVLFVGWWSIAEAATAFASSVWMLALARFCLGLGEPGLWVAAPKAVGETFDGKQRGLAIGIYTMGATIGATVAPYLLIPIAAFPFAEKWPWLHQLADNGLGWRVAFILTGLMGLIWLVPWWLLYRHPSHSSLIGDAERRLIAEGSSNTTADDGRPWSWREIFTSRVVWLLLLARLITDPVWYFFQFWFPKYLHAARGLEQQQLTVTWVIYAAAGAGSLLGGWLSGRRIRRGAPAADSRLRVMLGCAVLLPLAPLVATFAPLGAALTVAVVVVAAALAWLINLSTLVLDLVPRSSLGTVFGVVAAGSTLGGILMNTVVAAMVSAQALPPAGFLDRAVHAVLGPVLSLAQGQGYGCWFLVMAFLHPLAWLLLRFGGLLPRPGPRASLRSL